MNCSLLALLSAAVTLSAAAQSYTVIHSFGMLSNTTGLKPLAPLIQAPDGTLYGTTSEGEGGFNAYGTVFKIQPDGSGFTVLKHFTNYMEAAGPKGSLVLNGDALYGTTEGNAGAIFRLNTDGSGFAVLKHFDTDADGKYPYAGLVLSGTTLFGTTTGGGTSGYGTVFKINTDGSGFAVLHRFAMEDGIYPYAPLVVSGSTLYGTTSGGGNKMYGTVFRLNTAGTEFSVLHHFAKADGTSPMAGLALSGATLYGVTRYEGSSDCGTVYRLNTDGSSFTVLRDFTPADGSLVPSGGLWLSGTTLYGTAVAKYVSAGAVYKLDTSGGGFEVLKQFDDANQGLDPIAGVWLSGTTLYGTTWSGGPDNAGTVFKVNTNGSEFTVLKAFAHSREGINPQGNLAASGSTLYGTTRNSAHAAYGTVYQIDTDGGNFTVLHSFGAAYGDGIEPQAGVTLSGDALFGTTALGGDSSEGTIFRLDASGGNYTVLKSFSSSSWGDGLTPHGELTCSHDTVYGTTTWGGSGGGTVFKLNLDGGGFAILKQFDGGTEGGTPESALVLSGSTLYGTTSAGGSMGAGTIFKIETDGSGFIVLKDYDGSDGSFPKPGLTLVGDTLYGMTLAGGSFGYGTLFKMNTDGSAYTVLREFDGFTTGHSPQGRLAASGTTLYGTTYAGGAFDLGTVFQIHTDGTDFALLKEFSGPEGMHPCGPLTLADGKLYGTTWEGGELNAGVVFSISLLPSLRIASTPANTVVLAWPHPSDGYALQQNGNLTTADWTSVPSLPAQVGNEWQVSLPLEEGSRLYRLHRP